MDVHYHVTTCLMLVGFALYVLGISSHAWKLETGYDYGLWYRCDRRECVFYKVDYFGPINVVRVGFLLSSLLLTVSAICLIIEVAMVIGHSQSKHKQRLGKTVLVTTIMADVTASACLAYYGYKTLTRNDKLPTLGWGFASTGGGVIALFLGTIVRVMGPPSTWSDIPCLKKKSKRNKRSEGKHGGIQIYKPHEGKNRKRENRPRPSKLVITHPTDIITYRKASEPMEGSCENLLMMSRQDSACSSPHHKYEEITLERDFLCGRRTSQTSCMTSSNRPSPRVFRDLSPRKSSSLPPGISPGFYAQVHRNPKQRTENPYEATPIATRHAPSHHTTLPSPRYHAPSPFRPIQVLTMDRTSIRSAPIQTPPPSPPLPPPPPPLSSATMEPVSHYHAHNLTMGYAPSPSSMHSFGSYGY